MPPARAWEFLAGVCIAVAERRWKLLPIRLTRFAALLGAFGMVLSVFVLKEGHDFPGAIAALPVASTLLLIIGSRQPKSASSRILSLPVLRWIGHVSYSWYLWHWPVLTLARTLNYGEHNLGLDIACGLLSLVLATLTYYFIEEPIRHVDRSRFVGRAYGSLFAGLMLICATVALSAGGWAYAVKMEQKPEYAPLVEASSKRQQKDKEGYRSCMALFQKVPKHLPEAGCLFGDMNAKSPRVVLWGDSHSVTFSPLLDSLSKKQGNLFLLRARGACAPINGISLIHEGKVDSSCAAFGRAVWNELAQTTTLPGLKAVVLAARWPLYLGDRDMLSNSQTSDISGNDGLPLQRNMALAYIETQLQSLSEILEQRGVRLLLISPFPQLPHLAPTCLARGHDEQCGAARRHAEARSEDFRSMFARLSKEHANVRMWDPLPHLCTAETCPAMENGIVLYSDTNHLTFKGALALEDDFRDAYRWLMEDSDSVSGSSGLSAK